MLITNQDKILKCEIVTIFLSILMSVLGVQKNRLIETVLLSTHNIHFVSEIRKLIFNYVPLYGSRREKTCLRGFG